MKIFKLIILLLVVGIVFGGAAFFAYQMFVKPAELDRKAEVAAANAPAPTPTPDYSEPAFAQAMTIVAAGDLAASQEALRNFISQFPKSPKLAEAKAELGRLNTDHVFTAVKGPGKESYTVVSGDALVKIASKTDSNAELIMRANNLLSINLSIGQELVIPKPAITVFIDRAAGTVTLLDGGNFFKEYAMLSGQAAAAAAPTDTTVSDKFAMAGDDRVAFGTLGYVGSDRWLMLAGGNLVVRSAPEANEDGTLPPMPPGIILAREDMEEIFPLVSRGTTVTIQ